MDICDNFIVYPFLVSVPFFEREQGLICKRLISLVLVTFISWVASKPTITKPSIRDPITITYSNIYIIPY